MSAPTAATRLIALLGDPIAHSLSPTIQNAAFRAAGVDGVYVALRCAADLLPGLLAGIAGAGGGGNVTLPHKARAASLLERATDAVLRTEACNTFWLEGGRLCGDNTDVAGFRAAVRALVGGVGGARVLLLGAGGAARASLVGLLDEAAREITVLNRTPGRAEVLRASVGGDRIRMAAGAAALRGEHFDLIVNATSLGLHPGDSLPLDFDAVGGAGAALDLVYGRDETPWVRAARDRHIPAADGLEMLLHQGAAAFERWWGRPAPLDVMRMAAARPSAAV